MEPAVIIVIALCVLTVFSLVGAGLFYYFFMGDTSTASVDLTKWTELRGVDAPYNDIARYFNTNVAACLRTCETTPGCVGVSGVTAVDAQQATNFSECYLKSKADKRNPQSQRITYIKK